MNENLVAVKATLSAFFATLGMLLGWRVIMLLVWAALMALDYISGTLAARQNGTWKSSMAREGIGHKVGMILVVITAMIADFVILMVCNNLPYDVINFHWPVVIFPLVTMWYIITEIGSIIENAMEMGAKVPAWLPKLLNATMKAVESVGENAIEYDEKEHSGLIEEE
jgi:toxin secretion/phage lysis holin